ncbi:hypothetical protein P5673_032937 [Acropora cervicornis]|uniref:Uncharacterized protein n=1 Tax=Acropora cervicornis TaxID=6130 RepID=A0AAD9PQQ3_ACRCE|nr:hypothetical protein P5673_032937 [Acropora cervicornis]
MAAMCRTKKVRRWAVSWKNLSDIKRHVTCLRGYQTTKIQRLMPVDHTQIWLANLSVKAEDKQLLLGIYKQLLQLQDGS